MMIKISEEDAKISMMLEEWYYFDENKHYVLRPDAPEEVKKAYKKLMKNTQSPFGD